MRLARSSLFGVAVAVMVQRAGAVEGEVTSDTTAQFYDVVSPSGQTTLLRRRLTTTLGAYAYDILERPKLPGQELLPDLTFKMRLRYDADFAADPQSAAPTSPESYVPGFSRSDLDLMYAYVEGRRFFKGIVGFKLGRQYAVDALGWWAFDGGSIKVTTPAYLAVEGYGGLEVRGGFPMSPAMGRWERDGIMRASRDGLPSNAWAPLQPPSLAPAFGIAAETSGVSWLHGRLSYRRVYNTGDSNVSMYGSGTNAPLVYSGTRVSQERLGYNANLTLEKWGTLQGGFAYDFYQNTFNSVFAALDGYITKKLTVGLDYDFYKPTFDGDAIWNMFNPDPTQAFSVRGAYDVNNDVSVALSGVVRSFEYATAVLTFMGGGNLGIRYKHGSLAGGLRGSALVNPTYNADINAAEGGHRLGGDVFVEKVFDERWVLGGRLSVWDWKDALRPDRDAFSVGYVLTAGWRFAPRSQAAIDFQEDINRLVGQRFRVVLWLAFAVGK